MPGYVKRVLLQFQHEAPNKTQHSPSTYVPPIFGSRKRQMTNIDTSPPFTKEDVKQLQQICGKFLYYTQIIDDTMIHLLNTGATQVNTGTEKEPTKQLSILWIIMLLI